MGGSSFITALKKFALENEMNALNCGTAPDEASVCQPLFHAFLRWQIPRNPFKVEKASELAPLFGCPGKVVHMTRTTRYL